MSRSKILNSALGTAFMASICVATPAMALDAKQCLPMAEMNAALKAEGQRTMIIGDRVAVNNDNSQPKGVRYDRYVNTVTSNEDGSLGYQLEGNLPRAEASTTVCIRAKLTNVHLYDINSRTIPQQILLGGKFDSAVRQHSADGLNAMLYADTLHKGQDGTERQGLPIVMFGETEHRTASITTKLPNGEPGVLVYMTNTDYTPAALSKLNKSLALNEPR